MVSISGDAGVQDGGDEGSGCQALGMKDVKGFLMAVEPHYDGSERLGVWMSKHLSALCLAEPEIRRPANPVVQ